MENWFDVLKELTYVKQNGEDTFVYKNHVLDYWETRCELWDLFTMCAVKPLALAMGI
jgi:hypothetical protein